jgi:hypothetical protein
LGAADVSAFAGTHDIVIERHVVNVTGRDRVGMLINGHFRDRCSDSARATMR